MGVKFGMEEGTFGEMPNFTYIGAMCSQGEKPQNQPLSKLNTGALCCAQCSR